MRSKKFLIMALAAFMVLGSAASSWATQTFKIGDADVKLNASLRLEASYDFQDRGDVPYGQTDNTTDFNMRMSPISRAGIWINYGKVTGFVEYGLKADSRTSSDTYLRHAYGIYDMGGGNSLLVGQAWSIVALHFPKQRLFKENALYSVGNLYLHRNQQIRFTHKTDKIILKIALEDNDNYKDADDFGLTPAKYLVEESTPALDASLTFKPSSNITLTPSGMIQRYKLKNNGYGLTKEGKYDVNSFAYHDVNVMTWMAALDGTIKSDVITTDFEAWYGQNVGLSAIAFDERPSTKSISAGLPVANAYGSDLKDVNSYGGWLQFAVPVNPVTVVYLGGGYQHSQVRNSGINYKDSVSSWGLFANFKYSLTKHFYIQPEVSYFNWGDAAQRIHTQSFSDESTYYYGNDLGTELYTGVFFQYDL